VLKVAAIFTDTSMLMNMPLLHRSVDDVLTEVTSAFFERERKFISQINGRLPDKAFAHRAGHP